MVFLGFNYYLLPSFFRAPIYQLAVPENLSASAIKNNVLCRFSVGTRTMYRFIIEIRRMTFRGAITEKCLRNVSEPLVEFITRTRSSYIIYVNIIHHTLRRRSERAAVLDRVKKKINIIMLIKYILFLNRCISSRFRARGVRRRKLHFCNCDENTRAVDFHAFSQKRACNTFISIRIVLTYIHVMYLYYKRIAFALFQIP